MNTGLAAIRGRGLHIFLFWITVMLVVAFDQSTKAAATEVLEQGPGVLIPGVMNLVYVKNTGAAFSMGEGAGLLFIVVAIAFMIGAVLFVWKQPDLPTNLVLAVGLVAGGGLGNMIDRIMDGAVTDFLATAFMSFPVFNVADICVTVGVAWAILGYWLWDSRVASSEAGGQVHA